jgi:hypothetical protein
MLEVIASANDPTRREASETWLFGQRVFARAPRESLPQVLVALRGRGRFRTLSATLERLDITDPAVYAAAFAQAQRIAGIGDADRTHVALSLFQGALVTIERARLGRTLNAAGASRLVASLARLPLSDDRESPGAVAAWFDAEYLPAVGLGRQASAETMDRHPIESALIGVFAGVRPGGAAAARTVEYEGATYAVEPAAPELRRLREVRGK